MTDPVASRSGFLCTYMSNHPDTLVAYVQHFGNVTARVASASMVSIDTKGMALSYVMKGTDAKKQLTVPFEPPLTGYDEVKPRLLSMKLDAEEALGMTPRPQITTFELPRGVLVTMALLSAFVYVTFSVPSPSPSLNIGPRIRSAIGPKTIQYLWILCGTIHLLEAAFTLRLCIRHSLRLVVGAKYVIATFLFGMPVIQRLRKLIQDARIDSISKIH
ncbi:hypothetical protein JB92DRAFT_2073632 [Gautieria morchelliformis]|nr:hypothetical protein JB92DRAFT_2073632 [Gautieria morchelliformis]